jgi:DNA mismatch endonuclease (patch repair protein)
MGRQPESPETTHKRLSSVGTENTEPEKNVQSAISEIGWDYELHRKDLPGTPDIVVNNLKAAIFVHGCFWHHHEDCERSKVPSKNEGFWRSKFERNKTRDREVKKELESDGWNVVTIWECETESKSSIINKIRNITPNARNE